MTQPDYLFESSWEVCNKVGGIYTVLSTKAYTLQKEHLDKIIFIGPDLKNAPLDFIEEPTLFSDWKKQLEKEGITIKTGRWDVPGTPITLLVDFNPFYKQKGILYYEMWEAFQVDSSQAYGDYDESCIFAYAVASVIKSFYLFYRLENKKVIAHFNEWMLGMGLLYLRKQLPQIATIFTTHATTVGRSIAGNDKPLYQYMDRYNGDQMADELNVTCKHSLEKKAAHFADSFTTVSDITAIECEQLLEKAPDMITPNGFEQNFVPKGEQYKSKRAKARSTLIGIAEKLTGSTIDPTAFLISTSGRYEYRNKGYDIFIDTMNQLAQSNSKKEIIAFFLVPAWVYGPRADLKEVVINDITTTSPMQHPYLTHWIHQMGEDRIIHYLNVLGLTSNSSNHLKIIFAPCYLDGNDGIFNMSYYDLLIGMDATLYPSYYEPWGYTPLESVAFGIPTVTTNLAGFGLWAEMMLPKENDCVTIVQRTDENYYDVVNKIKEQILSLVNKSNQERENISKSCFSLAKKAEWHSFIKFYNSSFEQALQKCSQRNKEDSKH